MIVRKLRQHKNWSQEQLAIMSGLSIRTIQRVESGQSASLETLKSLASVFETDISKLTEEITVIDKKSEKWQNQPIWLKFFFFGIRARKVSLAFEALFLIAALAVWFIQGISPLVAIILLMAYSQCALTRYADNKGLWDI